MNNKIRFFSPLIPKGVEIRPDATGRITPSDLGITKLRGAVTEGLAAAHSDRTHHAFLLSAPTVTGRTPIAELSQSWGRTITSWRDKDRQLDAVSATVRSIRDKPLTDPERTGNGPYLNALAAIAAAELTHGDRSRFSRGVALHRELMRGLVGLDAESEEAYRTIAGNGGRAEFSGALSDFATLITRLTPPTDDATASPGAPPHSRRLRIHGDLRRGDTPKPWTP